MQIGIWPMSDVLIKIIVTESKQQALFLYIFYDSVGTNQRFRFYM
jgi:hypothetical protein